MKHKGQSIVEAALVLPMILMVIFGIIEFGRLFNTKLTMNYAVSEGGKAISYRDSPDTVREIVKNAITGFVITDENIDISYSDLAGTDVSYYETSDSKVYFGSETQEVFATININYNYEPIVPFPDITTEQFLSLQATAYVKVQ